MQSAEHPGTSSVVPERFSFGLFEADLKAGELRKNGKRIRIQGQPFRVLAILLEHHGELVTREQIQQRLWGDNTTVDFDHSLGIAVNKLREALGDSADNPRFIETLARRGYRFIAPVTGHSLDTAENGVSVLEGAGVSTAASTTRNKASRRRVVILALGSALVGVAILAGWVWLRTLAPGTPLRIAAVTHHGLVLASQLDVENFSAMAVEGGRVYFSQLEEGRPVLAEALTANGEVEDLRLPSEIVAPLICSISRDGARLIVRNHLAREPEQPIWIVPALGGQARRFADVLAHDAAWMPDGQHILYAAGNALFAAREDGQENQQLITLPGRAFWLRWSPDGQLLRFTVLDPDSGAPSLWEYNVSNKKIRRLLDGWSQPAAECCGSWTPDGKAYVFESAHDGFTDIWQMRGGSLDRDPVKLTNGPLDYRSPATGAGSNRIFFTGIDLRREMLVYSEAAHRFLPLGNNLAATALVQYSRDGQWVAWLNPSDNTLWRSRSDGIERLQLTTPSLSIFSMRWSPDNRSLALMARKSGSPWAIYLIDANGGNLQPILEENHGQADPNWISDGSSILFGRVPDRMGGESQPKAIFTVNLQTHAIEKIPGSDGLFSPRLSPDGRYIAALRSDQKGMMLFDRETQLWTTLVEGGVADPVWASNSQSIFYQNFLEPGEPIYRIDLRSGSALKIATLVDLQPANALDYRLITLAPGDQPVVNTQSSSVNVYSLDLK
ncbi:MAG TPA: winged helix-turn-helix domain-containing protein [Pseudacidobacterium sp.]|nr:winged helix-turn-helix domain-containing protein [Pseudacidobacterium sp.]